MIHIYCVFSLDVHGGRGGGVRGDWGCWVRVGYIALSVSGVLYIPRECWPDKYIVFIYILGFGNTPIRTYIRIYIYIYSKESLTHCAGKTRICRSEFGFEFNLVWVALISWWWSWFWFLLIQQRWFDRSGQIQTVISIVAIVSFSGFDLVFGARDHQSIYIFFFAWNEWQAIFLWWNLPWTNRDTISIRRLGYIYMILYCTYIYVRGASLGYVRSTSLRQFGLGDCRAMGYLAIFRYGN